MGLRRVHLWSDEVMREDLDFIKRQCPDFEETFEACFVSFVSDRYGGKNRPTVRRPNVFEFVRRYIECLGQHEALGNGAYFDLTNANSMMIRRMACMESTRQCLYTLVTVENVRVETASEIGKPSVAPLQDVVLQEEPVIQPSDSISQVSVRSVRRPPPPPPVEEPEEEDTQEHPRSPSVVSSIPSVRPPPSTVSRHEFVPHNQHPASREPGIGMKKIRSPKTHFYAR